MSRNFVARDSRRTFAPRMQRGALMCTRVHSRYGYSPFNHGFRSIYHFGIILTQFVQVLLVLPHSNVDPACLFSMVRKTEE